MRSRPGCEHDASNYLPCRVLGGEAQRFEYLIYLIGRLQDRNDKDFRSRSQSSPEEGAALARQKLLQLDRGSQQSLRATSGSVDALQLEVLEIHHSEGNDLR